MDKLICAGKNYVEHAKEMKDGIPEHPVLFLKPPSVLKICPAWQERIILDLPAQALSDQQIHYECELVFLISQSGEDMSLEEAQGALTHVSVGLDMTHRGLQRQAKERGAPWEISKVFRDAATVGPWVPWTCRNSSSSVFQFELNGEQKQQGDVEGMRMKPAEFLAYASRYMPICKGDLLYMGTPAGVGPVTQGDVGKLILGEWSYEVRFGLI